LGARGEVGADGGSEPKALEEENAEVFNAFMSRFLSIKISICTWETTKHTVVAGFDF